MSVFMSNHGLVAVPKQLGGVSYIDYLAECRPEEAGLTAAGISRIWSSVERLYRTGLHPAITLVIRRRGKLVVKRSIGCVSGNAPGDSGLQSMPLHPDAPISLFSASKSITALLVHKLVELGGLRLDDRVADHIPEFAARGKGEVTVRQLMSHRAGIPDLPVRDFDPTLLRHWDAIIAILCASRPVDRRFRTQAYHALTAGYIIGELLRRVSGRELPELLREWLAEPLGCRHLTFGLEASQRALLPRNVCTGGDPIWPFSSYIKDIVGVPFKYAIAASNHDAFLSAVVPAGNICASADDVSRVFQMLLNGGELNGVRVLKPETVAEAVRPSGPIQFDRTLMVPMRFSAGFMLGEKPFGLFGPRCRGAFGHIGFVNVLCWADPQRELSVALLNTGKSVAPAGMYRLARVLTAINGVCKPLCT